MGSYAKATQKGVQKLPPPINYTIPESVPCGLEATDAAEGGGKADAASNVSA